MSDRTESSRTVDIAQNQQPSDAGDSDETRLAPPGEPGSAGPRFGPPAAPGEVGTLGPYRMLKELGKGGMGAVYLALDTRLNRKLAIKVLLPQFAANTSAKGRFLREAHAAAAVAHDNVVTIFEADERDGVPYIAMQFLQGYPLDEYLRQKGPPPLLHVLRIARETALGLAAAHALGLVHRDIKPANLWLEAPNGRVKVLDFGLAKPVGSDAEVTGAGSVVGTPAYMSPEQAGGEKVDHRTDLFSLGVVLYRLCTGNTPFSGPTVMAVLMSLGNKEPTPVRELNPNVPESLAALVHQLLAKNPEDRPQSATEVAKRLRAILEQLVNPPVPVATPLATPPATDLSTSLPIVVHPLPAQPPVVQPMHITVQPESVFAHLDDTTHADDKTNAPDPQPRPARKKASGRGPWVVAGLAVALAAAVAAGVIIIIQNKDGTETRIEIPDDAKVIIKTKDGKTVTQVNPGGTPPAVGGDPDRKAAEYVLSLGGGVQVEGGEHPIKAVADLPRAGFRLTSVDLTANMQVTDAGLAAFKDCKNLVELALPFTPITDAGLAHFAGCKNLTLLHLGGCDKITDAGLTHFAGCKNLETLNLHDTPVTAAGLAHFADCKKLTYLGLNDSRGVTDAGLAHIKGCQNLTRIHANGIPITDAGLVSLAGLGELTELNLTKTKVTAKGVETLAKALPKCKITWAGGVIEPKK